MNKIKSITLDADQMKIIFVQKILKSFEKNH